jgi:hypothetical protein
MFIRHYKSTPFHTVFHIHTVDIEPTSDTEAEDVLVEKSAVDLGGQKTKKKNKRDQPPEWFCQFEKRMREDRLDREERMKEHMKKADYQNERIKVMKETNELIKMLLTGRRLDEE